MMQWKLRARWYSRRLRDLLRKNFRCPVCGYKGSFDAHGKGAGRRLHARCPVCGSLERHRLQYLVLDKVFSRVDPKQSRMLHFAPEKFFREIFSERLLSYETADIVAPGVTHTVDIRDLPFEDSSYDIVYASHVLEHIDADLQALGEIARVLRPGGVAVLPVPIVSTSTVEYPEPNPYESYHVRAPGIDYFERYRQFFSEVEVIASDVFPQEAQLYTYDDRTVFPMENHEHRESMPGSRHPDYVPICVK